MSITGELREYAGNFYLFRYKDVREKLDAIADRIDAEHERAMAAAALITGVPITDEHMAEHGWIRLPVDADGEYIHFGDVMEMDGDSELREVVGFYEEGFLAWLNGRFVPCVANLYRHHHAPTVEDVLREFGDWYAHTKGGCDEDGIVAEYAAKLRLAGES